MNVCSAVMRIKRIMAGRRSLDLAIFLEEELFRPVPHQHWVWSVPKMLRLHFLHHRNLLPKLCRCAWDSIIMFLQEALDRRDVFPGGILKHLDLWEDPRPPPEPLEMVCEPDVDYIPWQDDVSEIEVG